MTKEELCESSIAPLAKAQAKSKENRLRPKPLSTEVKQDIIIDVLYKRCTRLATAKKYGVSKGRILTVLRNHLKSKYSFLDVKKIKTKTKLNKKHCRILYSLIKAEVSDNVDAAYTASKDVIEIYLSMVSPTYPNLMHFQVIARLNKVTLRLEAHYFNKLTNKSTSVDRIFHVNFKST